MTTAAKKFVHLHVHTCYSLLDGIIQPDDLVARAAEYKMPAVAVTDHGTMFGVMHFYTNAVKAGIKPIIGCEFYVAPRTISHKKPEDDDGISHLVLLAENMEGYRNLCRLATIACADGLHHKPRIDKELLEKYATGLIGLSGCMRGEIPKLINQGRQDKADAVARRYCRILGEDNFFLELQPNGVPGQNHTNQALLDMSQRLSIPLVGTNDCHYLDPEDSTIHEIALCLQTGKSLHDSDRPGHEYSQLDFKSAEKMCALLEPFPQAAENTLAIAERCRVEFDTGALHFPVVKTPPGRTMGEVLAERAGEGLQKRWDHICRQGGRADKTVYRARLDYELSAIRNLGLESFFLIMADVVEYAKSNEITIGPGRGSTCGSLVCFCLGITDLDPVSHGLLFERFVNPKRRSIPYFAVDICINGREAIYQYLADRYSRDDNEKHVAHIAVFGSLKSRGIIRDIGRVLGIPLHETNKIARLFKGPGNLDDALRKDPALKGHIDSRPEFGKLVDISRKLEGLPRYVTRHAAGIVISDKPLTCYTPLFRLKDEMITQFDAQALDALGIFRLDLLGLRELTVISCTLDLIKHQGMELPDLSCIDTTDTATGHLLSRGDTSGVFQLESPGMKKLLLRARPQSLSEVAVLLAFYRPGLLDSGMVEDYLERKQGQKEATCPVAELEPILKETFGLIIYQEQIMQIAQMLAGYTPAESDDLRKALGKKNAAGIAEHRQRFVDGACAKGIEKATARKLFEHIEYSGGYGINKAHSTAYALLAWQMAYLKAHFPAEFMTARLNCSHCSTGMTASLIDECRAGKIPVLPPDVNKSAGQFSLDKGQIRCGLTIVKKTDEKLADAIIAKRTASGPFASLPDFCARVSPAIPVLLQDRAILENLIKAGALDSTGATRPQMMAWLDNALKLSAEAQKKSMRTPPVLPKTGEWSPRLRLALEKTATGFSLSRDPLANCRIMLEPHTTTTPLSAIYENPQSGRLSVAGIWKTVTHRLKKDGFSDAKAKLEDGNASIEVMIPPKIYQKTRPILLPGTPVIVEGYCELDEFRIGPLQADRIMPLTDTDISKPSPRGLQGLPDNLPCPFCGHLQIWMRTEIEPPHNLNESTDMVIACQIQCAHCQALGPAGTIEMTADNLAVETAAIGQWNRRYCLKEDPGKKLKACPFCGHHPPKIGYFLDPDPPEVIETGVISHITCPKCGASVSMHTCDSCLTIWDSRVLYGGSCTC